MSNHEDYNCDCCGRRLSSPCVWMCGYCVQIAVELGLEAEPFHHPGDETMKILRKEVRERERAEATKRGDGQT